MKLETVLTKFELIADIPNSDRTIREVILQLAVRGLLTTRSDEETVDEQLALAQAFRSRRGRGQPADTEDVPFQIPGNWGWLAVGDAMEMFNGKAFRPEDWSSEGIPIIRIQNLNNENAPFNRCKSQVDSKVHVADGDFLISWSGTPGTSFGAFIWSRGFAYLNQHIFRCELVDGVFVKEFLRLAVNARLDEMISHAQGAVGLRHITKGKLESIRLPLPPLTEQKRIVAKVDELMDLCDRLEAQQQEREIRQAELARASLARFAHAPTPANLSFLFHPSYSITPADLRKLIVNLAVQGKLVSQNPNEESATELINRIGALRRARGAKLYNPIAPNDVPYEIPLSWAWARLGSISLGSDSGWSPQCLPEARSGTDWGVLKVSAVSWGVFRPDENKALSPGMDARPECEVKTGDFLLSRANTEELVARSVVVDHAPPHLMMSDKIVRFAFPLEVEKSFINLANLSDPSREYYARNASGTSSSMKNVGREVMCNLPIPVPPLAEQRRIVKRVEELMNLVDQLERHIASSRKVGADILDGLVADLVS